MKFSLSMMLALATAVAAAPASEVPIETTIEAAPIKARADCTLFAHWDSSWVEYAQARYRVRVYYTGNTHNQDFPAVFCQEWKANGNFIRVSNPQCFNAGGDGGSHYFADVSFAQGPVGYNDYKDSLQRGLNAFRARTNCDVNSSL